MRRSLLTAVLAAVLVVLPTATHAATVPDDVAAWFREEAPEVTASAAGAVLELGPEDLERVVVGDPVVVTTWAPAFRAGEATSTVLVRLDRWVAPLVLPPAPALPAEADSAGAVEGEPVGVVFARRGDAGAVTLDGIGPETELAAHLLAGPRGAVVLDEQTEGWFSYVDGDVAPVTAAARDVLAGEVRAEVYQPLLAERYVGRGGSAGPAPDVEEPSVQPAAWAAGVVVTLLGVVGVVVWLRRPDEEDEHRHVRHQHRGGLAHRGGHANRGGLGHRGGRRR